MKRKYLCVAAMSLLPGLLLADATHATVEITSVRPAAPARASSPAMQLSGIDTEASEAEFSPAHGTAEIPPTGYGGDAIRAEPGPRSGDNFETTAPAETTLLPQVLAVAFLLLVLAMELRHLARRRR